MRRTDYILLAAHRCRVSCDLFPAEFLHFELLSINTRIGIYLPNDIDLQLLVSTWLSLPQIVKGLTFGQRNSFLVRAGFGITNTYSGRKHSAVLARCPRHRQRNHRSPPADDEPVA